MIKNDRQYRVTRAQARRFAETLAHVEGPEAPSDVHPRLRQAQVDAVRGQLQELEAQLGAYEALRSGQRPGQEEGPSHLPEEEEDPMKNKKGPRIAVPPTRFEHVGGKGPLVLVGMDQNGYFKVAIPEGGHYTIGPGSIGTGPFTLRIYSDKTKNSMVLFNPGIQWVRGADIQVTRPIQSPERVVEMLMEVAGVALTPNPLQMEATPSSITTATSWAGLNQALGSLVNKAGPLYLSLKKKI